MNDNQTYFEFQVEKQVSPYPGNTAPRYPDMLRSANVEGEVLAQFVVDTTGRADMSHVQGAQVDARSVHERREDPRCRT